MSFATANVVGMFSTLIQIYFLTNAFKFIGTGSPYFVRDGDIIRLKHVVTSNYLALHSLIPCVTNSNGFLVSK